MSAAEAGANKRGDKTQDNKGLDWRGESIRVNSQGRGKDRYFVCVGIKGKLSSGKRSAN